MGSVEEAMVEVGWWEGSGRARRRRTWRGSAVEGLVVAERAVAPVAGRAAAGPVVVAGRRRWRAVMHMHACCCSTHTAKVRESSRVRVKFRMCSDARTIGSGWLVVALCRLNGSCVS